jgi:hypothetical protein
MDFETEKSMFESRDVFCQLLQKKLETHKYLKIIVNIFISWNFFKWHHAWPYS